VALLQLLIDVATWGGLRCDMERPPFYMEPAAMLLWHGHAAASGHRTSYELLQRRRRVGFSGDGHGEHRSDAGSHGYGEAER
jgi:hypothetical protein